MSNSKKLTKLKNKIVVIGSSNVDLIMKMDRLPEKGETVTGARFYQEYGGKGANQAVAAARAGGNVAFVSCIGDDIYAPKMIQNYKGDGIDSRFVFQEEGVSSGHALVMIGENGENCISVAPGANSLLSPLKIEETLSVFEDAAMFIMQFEIPEETIKYIIDFAYNKNISVLWNLAPAKAFDLSCLSRVNILVLNEVEAGFLAQMPVENRKDAEQAASALLKKGVEKVVITLGLKGAFVLTKNEQVSVAAYKVKAIDTTAAGDTFCGSFAVALVEGQSLKESLQFANAAAAISVTRLGAQPSVPTRAEIERFIKAN